MNFVPIDFETATHHHICAVGIVTVEDGRITDKFHALIQPPGNYYNWYNIQVHGITERDTKDAPFFDELFPEIKKNMDTIRIYAISKLAWIKKQQLKFQEQVREAPREFLYKEGHYFLGKRYLMKIVERDASPFVVIKHKTIEMHIRPNTDIQKKQFILDEWYRQQLKELAPPIMEKWEKKMGVSINELAVKKMKTKWGTCNCKPRESG